MEKQQTTGLIMLKNKLGIEHKIAKIEYNMYEDDSFEYIFYPYYYVIDLLTPDVFQGIPGLNLDLRRDMYIRKDIVPVFISERTPGPNRVDLQELLSEVRMTYLNRLEWLIRTDYIYSGDTLYVVRYDESYESDFVLQTGKESVGAAKYAELAVSAIAHGKKFILNDRLLSDIETANIYKVLSDLLESNRRMQKRNRQIGINRASANGCYKGRRKINLDIIQFQNIKEQYAAGKLNAEEAISALGVSRSTFYRRLKEG